MATFERKTALALERQFDGSASQSVDCGVAACVMALDDASYGLIRPSTEAVRKRMGGARDATNPDQRKAAIDSFAERFTALGLQPPRTSVARGKSHAELWRLLHDKRRWVIAALHYGTVASEKRALWASRSFRGNHAVYLRAATLVDEARKVPTYDPLADGRFKGCPNGRRLWPFWLVKAATGDVRDEKGRRLYPAEDRWIGLVVSKARPIGEPDDGVDPGDPDGGMVRRRQGDMVPGATICSMLLRPRVRQLTKRTRRNPCASASGCPTPSLILRVHGSSNGPGQPRTWASPRWPPSVGWCSRRMRSSRH